MMSVSEEVFVLSDEHIYEKVYDLAYRYEAERGSCPQCVLAALFEVLGVGSEEIIKAGDGLAGGSGLSAKGSCGALVGGMMAISFVCGRTYEDFSAEEKRRRVFAYTKKLLDCFVEEYGSLLCCDVHVKLFGRTYDLLDRKQYAQFEADGAHVDKCPSVAGNTARWTAQILIEDLDWKL